MPGHSLFEARVSTPLPVPELNEEPDPRKLLTFHLMKMHIAIDAGFAHAFLRCATGLFFAAAISASAEEARLHTVKSKQLFVTLTGRGEIEAIGSGGKQDAREVRGSSMTGFHVLNYLNVTEFGAKVDFPAPERTIQSEESLWKNSTDATAPLGPFVRHPEPMINKNELMPELEHHFDFQFDNSRKQYGPVQEATDPEVEWIWRNSGLGFPATAMFLDVHPMMMELRQWFGKLTIEESSPPRGESERKPLK